MDRAPATNAGNPIGKEQDMAMIKTTRKMAAAPASVFAAFEDSDRLAAWWGPAGFTNTFSRFEFKVGGKWELVMHGPDGKDYPNELIIREIDSPRKFVIYHISQPHYLLTVTFEPAADGGTLVGWNQDFENEVFARNMEKMLLPANEQLLDKLSAEALRGQG
jgi:uncharacterized protein YndB with AHSA1/START domain